MMTLLTFIKVAKCPNPYQFLGQNLKLNKAFGLKSYMKNFI